MKLFQCQNCAQPVFFENTACEKCGAALGYLSTINAVTALTPAGDVYEAAAQPGSKVRYCANRISGVCNWLVPAGEGAPALCIACNLTRTIPNLDQPQHMQAWGKLEAAKHRLVYSLLRLGLPLESKLESPAMGLAFDFLSDNATQPHSPPVRTGHMGGLITIDLAEADSVRREQIRVDMSESYRTLIGHFRHEVGHYYWERLVQPDPARQDAFRGVFGDERADYGQALAAYHAQGPPAGWPARCISAYATAHPWEDWAETWAHYLHLIDMLETAWAFGLAIAPRLRGDDSLAMQAGFDPYGEVDFDAIFEACIPLAMAVTSLNRGMGQPDLYPFVLPQAVVEKLRFIHELVRV